MTVTEAIMWTRSIIRDNADQHSTREGIFTDEEIDALEKLIQVAHDATFRKPRRP